MPHGSIMLPPGAIDCLTNNPEPGMGSLPSVCAGQRGQETPKPL